MPLLEKEVPEILEEEEILPKELEINEDSSLQQTNKFHIDKEKFHIGSRTLGWCLFLMLVCIALSIWKPDNELVKNGFEAFKLFAMTILGYMFGSNSVKSE